MSQQRLISAIIAFAFSMATLTANAQEQAHVALKNVNELMADLNYIVQLDTVKGKQQWPNLEALLQVFLDGVHQDHPLRMDVLLDQKGQVMRFALPIDSKQIVNVNHPFVQNIAGWIGARPKAQGPLIMCQKGSETIWIMQVVAALSGGKDASGNPTIQNVVYGLVSEDRQLLAPMGPNPVALIQPVLAAGYDVAGFVTNKAAGGPARRAAIQALRKQIVPLLTPLLNESEDDFEIRKLATGHQLDELERIYAEVENLTLGWTTDVPKKEARLDLEMTALAGTPLEMSLLELAEKPSLFGATQKSSNSIYFGRVNHALDEMRQKYIADLLNAMQIARNKYVAANKDYSDEKKAALTKAIGDVVAILNAGTNMGVIDAFTDVSLAEGKRSSVGGIKLADGHALVGVLENLKAGGWNVEVNIKEENGARWHSLEFPAGKELAHMIGGNAISLVTTADAVLYATGADANTKLSATLELIKAQTPVDGVVLDVWAQMNPWIDYLNERKARQEAGINVAGLTDMEKQDRKEGTERRASASAAFSEGGDTIQMKIVRQDKKLTGTTTFGTGILRFVGMMMTQFSKETLE